MYFNIVRIIEFFKKFLCFDNVSWMCCFGRLTWPRMSDMIISNFLAKVCCCIFLDHLNFYWNFSRELGSSNMLFPYCEVKGISKEFMYDVWVRKCRTTLFLEHASYTESIA